MKVVMSDCVSIREHGHAAVITIDNPPVNALSQPVRQGLLDAAAKIAADDRIKSVVLTATGRTFPAGADIREFDKPSRPPHLTESINALENLNKPVVAALFGTVLGGGLELAMGCHYRIASPNATFGQPEVSLGIIPGAGGTQRLPRLVGVDMAMELIVTGRRISGATAENIGVLDEIVTGDLLEAAIACGLRISRDGVGLCRTSDLHLDESTFSDEFFSGYRAKVAKRHRGFAAPLACVDAVEAAAQPFALGIQKEREISDRLKGSNQSRALRYLFFGEREVAKIPDIPKGTALREIKSIGVLGAGTMGSGIAVNFLRAGFSVTLLEADQTILDQGIISIQGILDRDVERGRLSAEKRSAFLNRLSGFLEIESLSTADVVVEAVFENLELKKDIFSKLDKVCKPGCILASNTSTFDINEIASATGRPEDVIGMHFFSPAHVMKLLEVVRGDKTAKDVVATIMHLGKALAKIAVLSGVGFGFIGNRMFEDYIRESQMLLLEGATPSQVDGVIESFGMAMGPCAVMDLAGLDISYLTRAGNRHHLPDDSRYCRIGDVLYGMGRYGQKTSCGFYKYQKGVRRRQDDPEVEAIIRQEADMFDIPQRNIDDVEILERCIYPLVNVGSMLLDTGIALRPGDIDVVWTSGYGFPRYRGGPMFYADQIGPEKVVNACEKYAAQCGNRYDYWTPAPLLAKLVADGGSFGNWSRT